VSIEAPLHVSNVQLLDPVSGWVHSASALRPLQRLTRHSPQRRRSHRLPLFARWVEGACPRRLEAFARLRRVSAPFLRHGCAFPLVLLRAKTHSDAPALKGGACASLQLHKGSLYIPPRTAAHAAPPHRFGSRAASLPRGR